MLKRHLAGVPIGAFKPTLIMSHIPIFSSALLTDLYELTMAASYFEHKPRALASFDLFIRDLPKERSFFLAAGLADIVEFLSNFHFDQEAIDYLKGLGIFSGRFLNYLKELRFRGSLWALPEGTIFFPNEPVLRVVAPIIEAQIIESYLLNTINLQTTIATKAARVVLAAQDKNVFDFSLRRTHGADAAVKAARSAYLAGFSGTSNCLAGKLYGIPAVGTMAHSFVMSFDDELASFQAFAQSFPKNSTILVDTYDTMKGVKNAILVALELEKKGQRLKAIRLDSGDLVSLSKKAREMLDKAGLPYVKILASGNLDEYRIAELIKERAAIDSFGVGTKMGVSEDAPYCDVIYKLNEITDGNGDFLPTMKLSLGKVTYPGRKQIYRQFDPKGKIKKDIIGLENEKLPGTPLLVKVMDRGKRIYKIPSLPETRSFTTANLANLPASLTSLKKTSQYPVKISPKLKALTKKVSKKILNNIKDR